MGKGKLSSLGEIFFVWGEKGLIGLWLFMKGVLIYFGGRFFRIEILIYKRE